MRVEQVALAALVLGCQVAKHSAPEQRLEAVKSPVPVAALPSYEPSSTELAPTELRAEARTLAGVTVFRFEPSALHAGRSYRLRFTASSHGAATVALKFREVKMGDSFRTYALAISGKDPKSYSLELTAPAYAERAELVVESKLGEVSLGSVSLTERAASPRTEPVASWAGSFVPPGYALAFNDEFSGTALNRSKWFTRYIYSSETLDRLNDENQRYTDGESHQLKGGVLFLTARRNKLSRPSGVNYESGMIRSDFTLRYGFLEARVKMPGGLGVWPAFWLNSDVSDAGKLSHPPEIDIFEFVNNGKDDKINGIHSAATKDPNAETRFSYEHPSFNPRIQTYRAPFNFNDGFHTIGAEWTPDEVSVFVDGLKIYTRNFRWVYKDGAPAGPAHVLLNLAIGGAWAGRYGIDDAAFPQSMAVDWVRVYQKVGG
jgi:beta-glucanase (GH16 family)